MKYIFALLFSATLFSQDYNPISPDTVYLITFKSVTIIPQPCPDEGNIGCLVFHFKADTSGVLTKIFYEEKDSDKWIEENRDGWMYHAIEIKKEKLIKCRAEEE